MSNSLSHPERRTRTLALLAGIAFASSACAADESQYEQYDLAVDSLALDTLAAETLAADTLAYPAALDSTPSPAGPAPTESPGVAPPPAPDPAAPLPRAAVERPRVSRPDMALPTRDRRPVAQVVQGLAQIELGAQLAPADYLRVQLLGTDHRQDALTSGSGEFFFRNVPAGGYTLEFQTVDKEARLVHRVPQVTIAGGELVRIGPFRISIEAVKSRR